MKEAPIPQNDDERIKKLESYQILDTKAEKHFDEITKTASLVFNCEIALISLVDRERQWFKSKVGLDVNETPRNISFCGHAIIDDNVLVVENPSEDERFCDNPLVTASPQIAFYAGAPLITEDGYRLGTLCLISSQSKKITNEQKQLLAILAKQVVNYLEIAKSKRDEEKRIKSEIEYQKVLENELRTKNEYLDLALEGAGLGIWDWSLEDNSVQFDHRWAEMLGYDLSELEMNLNTWESKVHPDDLEKCYKDIQAYMNGSTSSYENIHRMKHKNGHWVYILDKGRFSAWNKENKPIRFTGTHLDITETKKAYEDKIAEFTSILSSTPSCLSIIDSNGKILNMNKQGLDMIEAKDLTTVSGKIFYDLIDVEYKSKYIEMNQNVCSGNNERLLFKMNSIKGNQFWIESYAAPFKLPSGELAQIAISNDISERLKSEDELRRQKKIAEHQSKLASLGQLAASVGHEINNPIALIKGYVGLIKDQVKDAQDYQLIERIEKIDIAVDRVIDIVKGFKTFSRVDNSSFNRINFSELIRESVNLVEDIYLKENIHIDLDLNESIFINANRGRIQQVIINLLSNAKDAMIGGNNEIKISLFKKNKIVILRVRDNGSGIDKSILDNIFEPFFTTKDVNAGTGIGLAISHQIIKEHKGNIFVEESRKDQGTSFVIELPLDELQVDPVNIISINKSEKSFDKVLNILIVDDEEGLREILKFYLKELGHLVDQASNGKEALEIYTKNPGKYDLIISDIQMPYMDGLTMLKKMSELTPNRSKYLVISGGVNVDFNKINEIVDGYLPKPFDMATLEQSIRDIFND